MNSKYSFLTLSIFSSVIGFFQLYLMIQTYSIDLYTEYNIFMSYVAIFSILTFGVQEIIKVDVRNMSIDSINFSKIFRIQYEILMLSILPLFIILYAFDFSNILFFLMIFLIFNSYAMDRQILSTTDKKSLIFIIEIFSKIIFIIIMSISDNIAYFYIAFIISRLLFSILVRILFNKRKTDFLKYDTFNMIKVGLGGSIGVYLLLNFYSIDFIIFNDFQWINILSYHSLLYQIQAVVFMPLKILHFNETSNSITFRGMLVILIPSLMMYLFITFVLNYLFGFEFLYLYSFYLSFITLLFNNLINILFIYNRKTLLNITLVASILYLVICGTINIESFTEFLYFKIIISMILVLVIYFSSKRKVAL